jgi:hypothetical protein
MKHLVGKLKKVHSEMGDGLDSNDVKAVLKCHGTMGKILDKREEALGENDDAEASGGDMQVAQTASRADARSTMPSAGSQKALRPGQLRKGDRDANSPEEVSDFYRRKIFRDPFASRPLAAMKDVLKD